MILTNAVSFDDSIPSQYYRGRLIAMDVSSKSVIANFKLVCDFFLKSFEIVTSSDSLGQTPELSQLLAVVWLFKLTNELLDFWHYLLAYDHNMILENRFKPKAWN